jgi:hypothetical protein
LSTFVGAVQNGVDFGAILTVALTEADLSGAAVWYSQRKSKSYSENKFTVGLGVCPIDVTFNTLMK